MPSSDSYCSRFGGLLRAYELVGFKPNHDYRYLEINKALRRWCPMVIGDVVSKLRDVGAVVSRAPDTDLLRINDEWTASVVISRCCQTLAGSLRWRIVLDTSLCPDVTVAVRMERLNDRAKDYYVIPFLDMGSWPTRLSEENTPLIDSYRFETLDVLEELAERVALKDAA